MQLYQPVLFVGLGGTGCDIGAELERRLREEICGPDGNEFRKLRAKGGMLPYQLPSCIQFVYADMNKVELDRLPRRVVPGPEHVPAVTQTASYVSELVPDADSYPDLAVRLRLQEKKVVENWLPPATADEPKVNPLHRGAGQYPTIGRAALFGTFSDGVAPATRDIHRAVGKLAGAGEDLYALGGKETRGIDVFVAFSVAGGTGSGIFYDYLHLIAHTLQASPDLKVKIYPLVLMPSAFAEGLGGGRPAELNGGRALLDLFRLVDQQNGGDALRVLRSSHDQRPAQPDDVTVTYPGNERITIRAGTVQTGFLFSLPAGAGREDMHRSIVSLVMSLIGTEMSEEDDRRGEHHQSFADSFVNQATKRQVTADNGIGNRGVSTALVASLTVPVDELAGIVASRLLRHAVERISAPNPRVESTRKDVEDFMTRAAVHQVLRRQGIDHAEPPPANGARDVTAALNDRRESMRVGIEALRSKLSQEVPRIVNGFNPGGATNEMLGTMDIFKVQRVGYGHQDLSTEVEQGGVSGLLHRRRAAPEPPPGFGVAPPVTPELRDKFLRKVQWNDPEVVGARNQQNAWYEWQTQVVWAQFWDSHVNQWRLPLEATQRDVAGLTRALTHFAQQDVDDFTRRSADLYLKRVGVSYLLPAGTGRMEQFYQQVYNRLREQMARTGVIKVNSSEADLVRAIVGTDTWPAALKMSIDQTPEHAVSYLREVVKTAIKKFLREPPPGEQPMLPKLQDLLIEAAGHGRRGSGGGGIQQEYIDEFNGKLVGLLPGTFIPQGSGELKVLINYPADAPNEVVEEYLKSTLTLPRGPKTTHDFRSTKTESISVVLFRTGMGVTEVGEVRDVLRRWARALSKPQPTDLLRWRQRTGYDFGYLATREDHRVVILHRLLCALWNGYGTVERPKIEGKEQASPERLNVELGEVTMTLPLIPLGQASSWGSLLRAYELWALDDNDLNRRFCAQLMQELPEGVDASPSKPGELYVEIRKLAKGQIELLDKMMENLAANQRSRHMQMRGFWANTLPSALDLEFTGVQSPIAQTLRTLEKQADPGLELDDDGREAAAVGPESGRGDSGGGEGDQYQDGSS